MSRAKTLLLLSSLLPLLCWGQSPTPGNPGPVSIETAIQEALTANLDLIAERLNVPQAKAREITAALRPNPRFSLTADYIDLFGLGLSNDKGNGPTEIAGRVEYTIEGGGKRKRRIEAAQLATSVAEFQLLDAIRRLILEVRLACVDYSAAFESLELSRRNLAVFEEVTKVNEAKVKAGELAGVELIRIRVAREQLQNSVRLGELRVRTVSNQLQRLIGRKDPDPSFRLDADLSAPPRVELLDDIRAEALRSRPDLLATRKDVERAGADTRLQIANGKIDYTVSAAYQNQMSYVKDGHLIAAGLTIPLPVFDRNQGEIARARIAAQQAEARVRALQRAIQAEIDNAWAQYNTSRELVERIRGRLLPEAEQVREITGYSYRRGEASLLEFLDAQRAYNDAVQSFNDARADYLRSLYTIDAVAARSMTP